MNKGVYSPLNNGFTFIEMVSIIAIIGILIAMIAPSWLGFIGRQQLRTSTNKIYWAMQNARSKARAERISWQASFKLKDNNQIQYAVHRADIMPANLSESAWQYLADGVQLDLDQTSLLKVDPETNNVKKSETGYYRAIFNYKGCPVYWATDECTQTSLNAKGRITLSHQFLGERRQCVIISTLIGALRTAADLSEAQSSGESCYRD